MAPTRVRACVREADLRARIRGAVNVSRRATVSSDSRHGGEGAPAWLGELGLRADGPPWLSMGLRRVDGAEWLVVDDRRQADLALRAALLADRPDEVVHLGEGTGSAGEEVLALVEEWLRRRLPADAATVPGVAPGGPTSGHGSSEQPDEHPLVAAARMVQEDLCLMFPRRAADGTTRHHLDAAVVCFPSHWRLADKAGGTAAALHRPVPRYDTELADRVDRYLARLRPGVIGVRRNWSIHDDDALFAPVRPSPLPEVVTADVGDALWLRSERQTLRTLAGTGAVLFTIRVQQCPMSALAARPDIAAALADRLRAQPPSLVEVNGVGHRLGAVTSWLDSLSSG